MSYNLSATNRVHQVLPIKGSWINLYYQDERNKYTNPENMDNTDPEMWKQKVRDMHNLGGRVYSIYGSIKRWES